MAALPRLLGVNTATITSVATNGTPTSSNGNGNKPYRLSQQVVNTVAIVVTIVWGISFIADILVPGYDPPTNVHMALMVVLGGVFGSQFVKRD
jgi:hypothetical protein